jgi:putative endonuclease
MYFVYILRTSSNTLYIGQTNNLEKRIIEHRKKSSKSARYIRYFSSFKLVHSEKYKTRKEAMISRKEPMYPTSPSAGGYEGTSGSFLIFDKQ